MGNPAARLGDSTCHGGVITGPGCPTVLIGGMPAACMGDMHVCPMVTPATPPIPHVGGPITLGSTGVFIGGKPAARMGDMAVCVGPPSTIIMGCMTVLIGEAGGGGGSGGAGAGGGGGGGSGSAGALASAGIAGQTPQNSQVGDHYLDLSFMDGGNLPVGGVQYLLTYPDNSKSSGVLGGKIKRLGLPDGSYTVTLKCVANAQWSVATAKVGNSVDLIVDTVGIDSGAAAKLQIYIRDSNYADHLLEEIDAQVSSDQIRKSWTLQLDDKFLAICDEKSRSKKFSKPFFFFKVIVDGFSEQSGILNYQDWIEIKAVGKDGKPAANEDYILRLPTGEIQKGKLDGNGYKKIENIDPSKCDVEFPNMPEAVLA